MCKYNITITGSIFNQGKWLYEKICHLPCYRWSNEIIVLSIKQTGGNFEWRECRKCETTEISLVDHECIIVKPFLHHESLKITVIRSFQCCRHCFVVTNFLFCELKTRFNGPFRCQTLNILSFMCYAHSIEEYVEYFNTFWNVHLNFS